VTPCPGVQSRMAPGKQTLIGLLNPEINETRGRAYQ
jgi:hypothetical protein